MKEVIIYFEGGGSMRETQAQLRNGMNAFLRPLKDLADSKGLRWRLVALGGRDQAFQEWNRNVGTSRDMLHILLVDSEEEVTRPPCEHLRNRVGDGWVIKKKHESRVHLMAQCMESWLVADPNALAGYYGKGFKPAQLPNRANLEEEPKRDVDRALKRATRDTSKGHYDKIKHASVLLTLVDSDKARARCAHCERLFRIVSETIGNA